MKNNKMPLVKAGSKPLVKTKKDKRIPRPIGITSIMTQFYKSPDEVKLKEIYRMVIHDWIIGNSQFSGVSLGLGQFASFLGYPEKEIKEQMKEEFLNCKLFDEDNQKRVLESLYGQQLIWNLEDRMMIERQVATLEKSQRGKFNPFVTPELNRAMGLKMTTTSNLMALTKAFSSGGNVNIFNQHTENTQINTVSVEEALTIVQKENEKLALASSERDQELKYIEAHNDLSDIPEVVATKQVGMGGSKDGISLVKASQIEEIINTDYKTLEPTEKVNHSNRREHLEDIDANAPDPELNLYAEEPTLEGLPLLG